MIFQEPMASLNPCFTVGFQIEEVLRFHIDLGRRRAARRARSSCCKQVGIPDPDERLDVLPAPDVGRPVPARDDRHGHRLQSEAADRRRADHRARRDHPEADPRPADVSLQAEHGMGLIMITHNMGVVAETADRVMVQYKGRKMEEADVLSLFESPKSTYTRALLSACPRTRRATGCRPSPTILDDEAAIAGAAS